MRNLSVLWVLSCWSFETTIAEFQFTDKLLKQALVSVRLSLVAYSDDKTVLADYALKLYKDNPDQAAVTQIDGTCYSSFRGTDFFNWKDLFQNLQLGNKQVCNNGICCNVERGFYDGYHTNYKEDLERNVRRCAATCDDGPCPVVLTGHSQGGAIASVAALYLADLDPIVITFGQMAAIDKPCSLINSEKYYRFENSRSGYFGPTYDPIPNLPYSASHFGHQIMLGDDSTGVAYIGKDSHVHFRPYDTDRAFRTHRLIPQRVGYVNRIENLAAHYEPSVTNTKATDTAYERYVKTGETFADQSDAEASSTSADLLTNESALTSLDRSSSDVPPVAGNTDAVDASETTSTALNQTSSELPSNVDNAGAVDTNEAASTGLNATSTTVGNITHNATIGKSAEPLNSTSAALKSGNETAGGNETIVKEHNETNVSLVHSSDANGTAPPKTNQADDELISGNKTSEGPPSSMVTNLASLLAIENGTITKPVAVPSEIAPKFLVRSNGFVTNSRCSKEVECISRICKRKRCQESS